MLGKSTDAMIQFADWYATFCHLAGVNPKDDVAISKDLPDVDSINQWNVLWSEAARERDEFHVSPVTLIAYGGKWKLLTGPDPGNINSHTVPGFVPFNYYGVGCAAQRSLESARPIPTPFTHMPLAETGTITALGWRHPHKAWLALRRRQASWPRAAWRQRGGPFAMGWISRRPSSSTQLVGPQF